MTGFNIRPSILAARERLKEGREKLQRQHESGKSGSEVAAAMADLLDVIVLDLFDDALSESTIDGIEHSIALVPHGGYGRQDVAPYSDVDLMLVRSESLTEADLQPVAQRLTQDICDVGLTLGFSQRTPAQATSLAAKDATVLTSISEARFLGGSVSVFKRYMDGLHRQIKGRWPALIKAIVESRDEERAKYGDTVYLLRPNVKRSTGALRDIQMIRWVGFARHGEVGLERLVELDAISQYDFELIRDAHEFLLRLRNELHFHAGKAQDLLDRDEQVRLAEEYGFEGDDGLLPVEQFMRVYFEHTSAVRDTLAHFIATAKTRRGLSNLLAALASHNVEGDFRVGPVHIAATRRGLEKVRGDLVEVLRLMDLANLYNKWIEHRTWEAIREAMQARSSIDLTPEAADRFLSLISQPPRLADLLRRLHEMRVLEQILPGMEHARCLLQFNEYHRYTVDEHSIRAVEEATNFLEDDGALGRAYRAIKDKRILHLALLIHDLGKGFPEDHSEIGARFAIETAERLRLSNSDAEVLRFLVHKHLLMSDLAQRRDINDRAVIVDFAVQVGSPEVLRMLYVMTCADLASVGPGVLNNWKLELLTTLYRRTRRELSGSEEDPDDRQNRRLDELRELLGPRAELPWWRQQLDGLPSAYVDRTSARDIVTQLEPMADLPRDNAIAWGRYLPENKMVQYTIGAYESLTPGIFHRLTGVLSSRGHEILIAEIDTFAEGLVLDRFFVQDTDYQGEPPDHRINEVCGKLVDALCNPTEQPPSFRRVWGQASGPSELATEILPTKIQVDNGTSESFTILDVFAHDRRGLLYTITRLLFELDLSVHVAKIGSYVDQVVDVFYVSDAAGEKVTDEQRLNEIRHRLLDGIAELASR